MHQPVICTLLLFLEICRGRGEVIQFAAESRPAVRTVETAVETAKSHECFFSNVFEQISQR